MDRQTKTKLKIKLRSYIKYCTLTFNICVETTARHFDLFSSLLSCSPYMYTTSFYMMVNRNRIKSVIDKENMITGIRICRECNLQLI